MFRQLYANVTELEMSRVITNIELRTRWDEHYPGVTRTIVINLGQNIRFMGQYYSMETYKYEGGLLLIIIMPQYAIIILFWKHF
jgi:hypothetical protein